MSEAQEKYEANLDAYFNHKTLIRKKALESLPKGFGLIIFEVSSHNDGEPYNWRFFALPVGRHHVIWHRHERGDVCRMCDRNTCKFDIIDDPDAFCWMKWDDFNAQHFFRLPKGSLEFIGDCRYVPRRTARYFY